MCSAPFPKWATIQSTWRSTQSYETTEQGRCIRIQTSLAIRIVVWTRRSRQTLCLLSTSAFISFRCVSCGTSFIRTGRRPLFLGVVRFVAVLFQVLADVEEKARRFAAREVASIEGVRGSEEERVGGSGRTDGCGNDSEQQRPEDRRTSGVQLERQSQEGAPSVVYDDLEATVREGERPVLREAGREYSGGCGYRVCSSFVVEVACIGGGH